MPVIPEDILAEINATILTGGRRTQAVDLKDILNKIVALFTQLGSGSTLTEIVDLTRRTLLSTSSNWDAGNNYIGTAITGSVGDYFIDANYLYQLFNKTGSTTVLTAERKTISGVITDFTYTITCDGTTELFSITNLLNNQNFEATLWYTDSSDTTIPSGGRRLQTVYGLDATDATIYINISGFNPATRVYTLYTIGRWKAPVASGSSWVDSGWVDSGWVN